jgi:hypothetical protein
MTEKTMGGELFETEQANKTYLEEDGSDDGYPI